MWVCVFEFSTVTTPNYTPGSKKLFLVKLIFNETSQLAGKAYEDPDYTIVIAVVH